MEEQRCKSCEWWDSWYNECTHPEMPQGEPGGRKQKMGLTAGFMRGASLDEVHTP